MYIIVPRGSGSNIFDKYNINNETYDVTMFITPQTEVFTTGTMYAYDGKDNLYITRDATGRLFSLDVNNNKIDACGQVPYTMGGAIIGNRMEVIKTADGLYYLYIARHSGQEFFRVLLFWT